MVNQDELEEERDYQYEMQWLQAMGSKMKVKDLRTMGVKTMMALLVNEDLEQARIDELEWLVGESPFFEEGKVEGKGNNADEAKNWDTLGVEDFNAIEHEHAKKVKRWLPPLYRACGLLEEVRLTLNDLQRLAIVSAKLPLICHSSAAQIGQWLKPNTARAVDANEDAENAQKACSQTQPAMLHARRSATALARDSGAFEATL